MYTYTDTYIYIYIYIWGFCGRATDPLHVVAVWKNGKTRKGFVALL